MANLKTIDGETLMSKPLQPLNFLVDTLISQGLHILAGSPSILSSQKMELAQRGTIKSRSTATEK